MEQFEVVAGTYEEFLLGYKFLLNSKSLVQSFASHDHSSSIRSVAVSDHYLASGASDDRIIIYDLKTRKEHCLLTHHSSTVNCIQFTNNHSHIISGSADGVLAIVRVGNWQLEKLWEKAHNGKAILDIAVHPSGKLALTLGADASLKTWNLIKGRQAYIINLNTKSKDAKTLEKIIWAEDQIRFILYGGKYTEIWSIDIGGMLKVIEHDDKVCSCIWYNDREIIVGYENGKVAKVNVESDSKVIHQAHESRVKALAKYKKWIVSASSSGELKVWNKHFEEQANGNAGCRITCLLIAKILCTKKEEKDEDLVELKDEPVEKSIQSGGVVVVEVDESDEEKFVKKNKKKHIKNSNKNSFSKNSNVNHEILYEEENYVHTDKSRNKRKRIKQQEVMVDETGDNDLQKDTLEVIKKKKLKKKKLKSSI